MALVAKLVRTPPSSTLLHLLVPLTTEPPIRLSAGYQGAQMDHPRMCLCVYVHLEGSLSGPISDQVRVSHAHAHTKMQDTLSVIYFAAVFDAVVYSDFASYCAADLRGWLKQHIPSADKDAL